LYAVWFAKENVRPASRLATHAAVLPESRNCACRWRISGSPSRISARATPCANCANDLRKHRSFSSRYVPVTVAPRSEMYLQGFRRKPFTFATSVAFDRAGGT
jgi:hypothetical protein